MEFEKLSEEEFVKFSRLIHEMSGIYLKESKITLLSNRLRKRIREKNFNNFDDYYSYVSGQRDLDEVVEMLNAVSTNETYFFREIKHFEFLRELVLQRRSNTQVFRVWSAASSSGEEAYSVAMVLADVLQGAPWEVIGTDISTRMLQDARRALYPMERARNIPEHYLKRFCRKGREEYSGKLLIERSLRDHVQFIHANLNTTLPELGTFDVVFLRNVMIYFDLPTKRQVVARVLGKLVPKGVFLVGHSESLNDVTTDLTQIAPATYRRS